MGENGKFFASRDKYYEKLHMHAIYNKHEMKNTLFIYV